MGSINLPDMYADMQKLRVALAKTSGGKRCQKMEDENSTNVLLPSDKVKNVKEIQGNPTQQGDGCRL